MSLLTGLQSVWELKEASGNALDSHGSNTLAESAGDSIPGASGPGVLTGSRDIEAGDTEYLWCSSSPSITAGDTDFTVACWVNIESLTGNKTILCKYGTTGNQREYWLYWTGTGASARFTWIVNVNGGFTTGNVVANTFGAPVVSTWYHVVAWHDAANNEIGISVNGVTDTLSHSTGVFAGTGPFAIGARVSADGDYGDGLYSQAAFWRRVLTSTERGQLYASGSGLPYSAWGGDNYTLACDAGSFAITGQSVALRAARRLTLAAGSVTVTGASVALRVGRKLAMGAGSIAITGAAVTLRVTRRLACAAGSVAVAGQAVGLRYGRRLAMGAAALTVTGSDVGLIYGGAEKSLVCEPGSVDIVGHPVGLRVNRKMPLASGTLTVTGSAVELIYSGTPADLGPAEQRYRVPPLTRRYRTSPLARRFKVPQEDSPVNVGFHTRSAGDVYPLELDYTDVDIFQGDGNMVTAAAVTVSPAGLTVTAAADVAETNVAKFNVSGGTNGRLYTVVVTATNAAGQACRRELWVNTEG